MSSRTPFLRDPARLATTALVVFVAAMFVVHAVCGWAMPLFGDDWTYRIWDGRFGHLSSGRWVLHYLGDHWASADLATDLLTRTDWMHVLVTPLVALLLVAGVYTLAFGRLPSARSSEDVLLFVLASALLWIASARPGVQWFHRATVGTQLYGCAFAVWALVPWKTRPNLRTSDAIAVAVFGFLAGTASRQIGTGTLIAALIAYRRVPASERVTWMRIALAGLAIGTLAGYLDTPYLEVRRVAWRGFEPNLVTLLVPLREHGALVAIAGLLVIARAIAAARWPRTVVATREPPESRVAIHTGLAWLGLAAAALFGPRYNETTAFPAAVVMTIGVLPYFAWLYDSRVTRAALVAIAVTTHLVAWTTALRMYLPLHREYQARVDAIAASAVDGVATVPPYAESMPGTFAYGDDWGGAWQRQRVAMEVFHRDDIVIAPAFRRYEVNPGIALRLDTSLTPAQLAAAHGPALWATHPGAAREQFTDFIDRVRATGARGFTAQLVAPALGRPELGNRPVLVAWYDHDTLVAPGVNRGNPDENNRIVLRIAGGPPRGFSEAWVLHGTTIEKVPAAAGLRMQPMVAEDHVGLVCDSSRCFVADAFRPGL